LHGDDVRSAKEFDFATGSSNIAAGFFREEPAALGICHRLRRNMPDVRALAKLV
jgi:hypothetical protein